MNNITIFNYFYIFICIYTELINSWCSSSTTPVTGNCYWMTIESTYATSTFIHVTVIWMNIYKIIEIIISVPRWALCTVKSYHNIWNFIRCSRVWCNFKFKTLSITILFNVSITSRMTSQFPPPICWIVGPIRLETRSRNTWCTSWCSYRT